MKLEFSKKSIPEILAEFEDKKTFQWQDDIFDFLRKFEKKEDEINFHYSEMDGLYSEGFKHEFVYDVFVSLNNQLGLSKGNTALTNFSVLSNEGEIALIQAIVGELDLYCSEFSDEIRIPFTGENQTEIGYAIDYAFVTKKQVSNSFDQISRIDKLAIESDHLDQDLKNKLKEQNKTNVFQIFTADGLPVAVKNIDNEFYSVLDKVNISLDENDNLILSSPYKNETFNTQRQVTLADNNREFRWLSGDECRVGDKKMVVNLNTIEDKLKPYIDFNFIVVDFPEKESKIDVITLIIESRFVQEIFIPDAVLEDYEVPQQIFYIGEFPQSNDKSAIRAELKRLLKESNKSE